MGSWVLKGLLSMSGEKASSMARDSGPEKLPQSGNLLPSRMSGELQFQGKTLRTSYISKELFRERKPNGQTYLKGAWKYGDTA